MQVDVCEVGNSIDVCEESSQYMGRSSCHSNEMKSKQKGEADIRSLPDIAILVDLHGGSSQYPQIAISQDVHSRFAGPINIGNPSNVIAQTGGRQTLRHGERSNIANKAYWQ